MKINRKPFKVLAICKKVTEMAVAHAIANTDPSFKVRLSNLSKAICIMQEIKILQTTPACFFDKNGKIDKRRWKRYGTRSKQNIQIIHTR